MNAREANVLLTRVALLDGRFKRTPEEQAQMAIAWAGVLASVPLDQALAAVNEHYAAETRGIMPADIVAAVEERSDAARDLTVQREMRERDEWLRSHGITPAHWEQQIAAGQKPRDILNRFGVHVEAVTS